tara:strand:+ start:8339 stop:9235 length:897 start_codon:yes stop_codon:yes gene_type:complete
MMIGPGATPEDIQNLRQIYGLDKSIYQQFLLYLGDFLSGDLGTSISMRQDVVELIVGRLPVTLELALVAIAISLVGIVGLGITASIWKGRWPEVLIDVFSGFVQAVPDFLWALLFILIFGVLWASMPIFGRMDLAVEFDPLTQFYLFESLFRGDLVVFRSILMHILLPALSLALPLIAIGARLLKSSINESMAQDYVQLARVKGFSHFRIVVSQAFPNALIPTVTLTGVQMTFLIGGTVLVERIFGYPGLGNMAIDAVINRDLPLIQGIVLTFAVMFIVLNILIDMTYAFLNPRLRHD